MYRNWHPYCIQITNITIVPGARGQAKARRTRMTPPQMYRNWHLYCIQITNIYAVGRNCTRARQWSGKRTKVMNTCVSLNERRRRLFKELGLLPTSGQNPALTPGLHSSRSVASQALQLRM